MTTPTGERPTGRSSGEGGFDRRTLILSAVLLIGAILVGVGAVALFSDPGPPEVRTGTSTGSGDAPEALPPPAIVPRPNSGTAPSDSGDRGGWEQLALLGLIVAAIAGIGLVIARGGGGRAKANREAWRKAAVVGTDDNSGEAGGDPSG